MNQSVLQLAQSFEQEDDEIDLASLLDVLIDTRWLIAAIALVVSLIGAAYAFMATPIYQANILVQVEDSASSSKNILGDMSSMFDLKSAATAEMEILRSRFVVTRAVNNARLYISVEPKYFPLVGRGISRRNKQLSEPGLFGAGGYVWGAEQADVKLFNVPEALENQRFVLTAEGKGGFRLTQDDAGIDIVGRVGEVIKKQVEGGVIELRVDRLMARSGAQFVLSRAPIVKTVENLQGALSIAEKGKQSGVIEVTLEGQDPVKTAGTLNEIGREYIQQNVDRKSEEAEKSLVFLEKQLPQLKKNLESAEVKFNTLRNNRATVDLDEEAKSILQQSVLAQTRVIELKQKRDELLTRFQSENPLVEAVNQQMRTLNGELESINGKIRKLPSTQQDVFRLTRDVKVNTDLYTSLLNSAQQLRLVKASKVGNARLLDSAVQPLQPERPKQPMIVALSVLIGLLLGVAGAFIRKSLFGGIDDPHAIEKRLGLTVSVTVPHSAMQEQLSKQIDAKSKKVSVLAHDDPQDSAIESLRSFRTSLQFSMLNAKNNIVMITGPTPGIGKSFVSVNLAAVLASTGKKVLLIDGDLRKGYLHRYFGLERKDGLSGVISAQLSVEQAIHRNVMENVDFITTGDLPPRPAELLTHENFSACLHAVSARYDIVVIDTAPVLAVSDALVVAPHVGAIFNVVRSGISTMGEIEEAEKRFKQGGNIAAGIIFNDLKPRAGGYGYGSKYGKYRYAQYKY
ncbi:MAG: polysaccharide biosynthesis tyrosine autokinase [Methylophilaceae bacterium]